MLMLILMTLLFGTYNMSSIISEVLLSAALFLFFFPKCGVRRIWALLPFVRTFFLGKCADREPEGKETAVLDVIAAVVLLLLRRTYSSSFQYFILNAVSASLGIIVIVFRIRIYSGLCEVFGESKLWILFWLLLPFGAALIWGSMKRFEPAFTVSQMDEQDAVRFSGSFATELDNGLAVNLQDRKSRRLFETKYLLRDIHLLIPPRHMVLLLGGSGAGKTTLINAINGYEKANASVVLNGSNVYRQYKQVIHEIGYVPQKDLMRDNDTVARTLLDAASLRMPVDAGPQERRRQVEEVLDIFGLEPVKNSLVAKLSGGQRKRLSIAMEFIANPALFILDEPDSGLDGVMARELMERLRKIADTGKIVIVITHTPDRVIDLFDDVIVLAKDTRLTGRLAFYGSVDEAKEFFGKEKMEQIIMSINRREEGGEGRADEFIQRYAQDYYVQADAGIQ